MRTSRRRAGFSLIELIIVIVILGVISAIAIPRMITGADNADVVAMRADLSILRQALELCRYEHGGFPADATEFETRMTSTVSGNGPYLVKIPALKVGANEGETAVAVTTDSPPSAETASTGWLYNATTGEIFANATGYFSD